MAANYCDEHEILLYGGIGGGPRNDLQTFCFIDHWS